MVRKMKNGIWIHMTFINYFKIADFSVFTKRGYFALLVDPF